MPERRKKLEGETVVELDPDKAFCILDSTQVEVGSGYTVSVDYNEDGKPIIDVKTYGEVDTVNIRRAIQKLFPGAQIRTLKKTGSMTAVEDRKI